MLPPPVLFFFSALAFLVASAFWAQSPASLGWFSDLRQGAELLLLIGVEDDVAAARFILLLGLGLLGGQRLLDPIVGDLGLLFVLFLGIGKVGAFANQEVFVSHGIVVLGIDLQRFVEGLQTGFDHGAEPLLEIFLDLLVLDGAGIFLLHAEVGAGGAVDGIPLGPGDEAHAVVGIGVLRFHGDELLIPLLRLVPLFLVEVEGSDGSDGDGVFGFLFQHLLEIVEGGSGHLVILWRIRAGDVLLHVGGGQIQAGGGKPRIEFDSGLEALDGLRILGGGKRLHALIELIARLELVTAHAKDRQRGHGEDQHYLAHIIARPPPSQSSDRLYRSRRRERCRSPWLPIGSLWKGRP